MNEKLFASLQYLIPQHLLSRAAGWLADSQAPSIKNPFIRWFAQRYNIDLSEAIKENPEAYSSFNAFFTRALKPGARQICPEEKSICCPADGALSQAGDIELGRIFQAKGHDYSLIELLGGQKEIAKPFMDGQFATIYLSPKDYHRVHMPLAGRLKTMIHVPGDLFSVNEATTNHVPRLFARNERMIAIFDTQAGPMAVIMVGAMIVASIETAWAGLITPARRKIQTVHYPIEVKQDFEKGEEMGAFKLGSTVVLLFGDSATQWNEAFKPGVITRMGEAIGSFNTQTDSPVSKLSGE